VHGGGGTREKTTMGMIEPGVFAFGLENRAMPATVPGEADALVLGVCPSAFHVSWRPPAAWGVSAFGGLAVDVEPSVFWPGAPKVDRGTLLQEWQHRAEAVCGPLWGRFGWCGSNGSSGAQLDRLGYFTGSGVPRERTAFTDALPVFTIKRGRRAGHREQGDALDDYNLLARAHDLPLASLPPRPDPAELPVLAAAQFGDRLRGELLAIAPRLVITLGQEAWDTLVAVADTEAPAWGLSNARAEGRYGARGAVTISGWSAEWLPLAHPGLLAKSAPWQSAHQLWAAGQP